MGVSGGLTPGKHSGSPVVVFPKYNNYMQDPSKFDPYSQVLIPLSLLGIRPLQQGKTTSAIPLEVRLYVRVGDVTSGKTRFS